MRCAVPALAAGALLSIDATRADETNIQALDEIVVFGRAVEQIGTADSASEGLVGYDDLRIAPLLRVGELVETVPGMVATQHSGTGKANQYFLRGFNLDHGTDFAATAEGVGRGRVPAGQQRRRQRRPHQSQADFRVPLP